MDEVVLGECIEENDRHKERIMEEHQSVEKI
jgi:hypothetical protein